jgi:hypothetical protein
LPLVTCTLSSSQKSVNCCGCCDYIVCCCLLRVSQINGELGAPSSVISRPRAFAFAPTGSRLAISLISLDRPIHALRLVRFLRSGHKKKKSPMSHMRICTCIYIFLDVAGKVPH